MLLAECKKFPNESEEEDDLVVVVVVVVVVAFLRLATTPGDRGRVDDLFVGNDDVGSSDVVAGVVVVLDCGCMVKVTTRRFLCLQGRMLV